MDMVKPMGNKLVVNVRVNDFVVLQMANNTIIMQTGPTDHIVHSFHHLPCFLQDTVSQWAPSNLGVAAYAPLRRTRV